LATTPYAKPLPVGPRRPQKQNKQRKVNRFDSETGPAEGTNLHKKNRKYFESLLYKEMKNDSLFRRITIMATTIDSSAGGTVDLNSFQSDSARTAGQEFPSYAARFGQFRVHGFTVYFTPRRSTPFQISGAGLAATGTSAPAIQFIVCSGPCGNVTTVSANDVLSHPSSRVHCSTSNSTFTQRVDWFDYLDAHLFGATNAAIPTDQVLRISFAGNGTTIASLSIFNISVVFDVEFAQII
jgi:hypothetical protein